MALVEGQTGTAPDGTRVVVRGGRVVPLSSSAPRMTPQEQIQLRDLRQGASTADEAARLAEQFVDVNTKQNSGGMWAIPGVASVAGAFDPEVAQMNALTARMAPQQRVPGSGTTSDRDLSLYLQAVPGMSRPGPANQAIARDARSSAARRAEKAAFFDRWAAERGTLMGAEEAFAARPQAPTKGPPKATATDPRRMSNDALKKALGL